jgi:hypothetical protein
MLNGYFVINSYVIKVYFCFDMCSAAHWLLNYVVRCNFDYHVHVMWRVPYVGWATSSHATVMICFYVYKKKKKKFRRSKWYQSSSSRVCLEKRKPRVELESKEQENLGILIAYNQDKKT